MTRAIATLSTAIAVASTACMAGMGGHAAHAPTQAAASAAAPPDMTQMCPVAVPGTRLAVADTADGEAVTFTTTPDRVGELRSRVHAMAEMHNRHHMEGGAGEMHGQMHGGGMMGGGMGGGSMHPSGGMDASMMPPPSRAAVEDVDGGARLVVAPNDPADLDRLRSTVRMHAQHMQETGSCGHGEPSPK